uniref:BH3-like motif containing, cell death inducer n=1 Tax=Chlorocebus sabaeus TaxID=60711 RepID=A0A0D9S423_CHLSB
VVTLLPIEGREIHFCEILESECVLYTGWTERARVGQNSGSSIYPEAKACLPLKKKKKKKKEPMLPKETVPSLTRYNLGSSAKKQNVPGHVLQRPSYLTRIQITLLCNSSAEAL